MRGLLELGGRHPVLVLLALAAVSALALAGLVDPRDGSLRLEIDPSVDRLLVDDDPERLFYTRIRHAFGDDETLFVALATEDVFTRESLQRVQELTERLRGLPGVKRVLSLATVPLLEGDQEGVRVETLDADPERLRAQLRGNPVLRGGLVSRDERVAAFVLTLGEVGDREFLASDYPAKIRAIAAEVAPGVEVWCTGPRIVKAEITRLLLRSLRIVLPATLVLGALVLALAFRSVAGVVLPLATIVLALLWTLGTLAWLGRPLDLVTVLVPPLILTLGLAYAMHVVAEWARTPPGEGEPGGAAADRVGRAMRGVALPALVASLTTAAGLGALALSPLQAIRVFGLASLLGVAYATLITFTLIPAGLRLLGRGSESGPPPGGRLLDPLADRLAGFAMRRRRVVVAVGCVVVALGGLGGTRIQVSSSYVGNLPLDSAERLHAEAIARAFGGANVFSIVLEGQRPDAFTEPATLAEIARLQAWLEAQPEIGNTTSVVDHLTLVHRALAGEPTAGIPETQAFAKQLLVFGGGDALESSVDLEFRTANLSVRADVDDSRAFRALLARIEPRLAELPPGLDAHVTGGTVLLGRAMEQIARGQLLSILGAFVGIYAILAALFTSLRVGLLALLPNAIPVAVYFGTLGLLSVPLNPSTSLVACIALGLAVDDTVHYLVRFQTEARRRGDERAATCAALRAVLPPISFTTVVLCLGFLTLSVTGLRNQVEFGVLAAFTLGVAWIVDVSLTPALCAGVRIVTLWDVLTVDLGRNPQGSIPLLRGLSAREARTVAAILDFRELCAGEALVHQGGSLSDVFVVIEGELEVWADQRGQRVDLYRAERGDVVGELSFFSATSPAHVVAIRPTRLLRFEDSDLEYLVEHHPRIAAHVYRALNLTQADRLAEATQRMRSV